MSTKPNGMPPVHEYAAIFPLDDGETLWQLADDIKENGQQEPIWMLGDEILDGRRRWMACIRAGVEPWTKPYKDGHALAFVVSKNLHRRHLGTGDRAFIAAKITTLKQGYNGKTTNTAKAVISTENLSQAEAAKILNVSVDSVQRAAAVLESGTPALIAAVTAGEIAVTDAAAIVDEPPKVQNAAVKAKRKKKAKTVKAAVAAINGPPDFDDSPEQKLDALFVIVPDDVVPAFASADEIECVCRDIDGTIKTIKGIMGKLGGRMIHPSVIERLKEVRKTLWANRSTHVCPYCAGDSGSEGCDACKSEGWMTATFFDQAPPERKEAMKKKGAKNVPI